MNIHRATLFSTILIGILVLAGNAYRLLNTDPISLVGF